MHRTNLSVRIETNYWVSWCWHLANMKTSYENCLEFIILCSNFWLRIMETARQKSSFPWGQSGLGLLVGLDLLVGRDGEGAWARLAVLRGPLGGVTIETVGTSIALGPGSIMGTTLFQRTEMFNIAGYVSGQKYAWHSETFLVFTKCNFWRLSRRRIRQKLILLRHGYDRAWAPVLQSILG